MQITTTKVKSEVQRGLESDLCATAEKMLNIFHEFPLLLDLEPHGDPEIEQYDFGACWTVQQPEASPARVDVAAAIMLHGGHYADIAKVLRRSRGSIQNMVVRDKELFSVRQEFKEGFLDQIEKLHMHAALRGDLGAQRFFLTTLAKDRGYVTRNEATGKDGEPLLEPTLTKEAIANMSEEVITALLEAQEASARAGAE